MDNHNRGQAVGNAAKIAADLTEIALQTGQDAQTVFDLWAGLFETVAEHAIKVNESYEVEPVVPDFAKQPIQAPSPAPAAFNPVQAVQSAFPGTQVITAPPAGPGNVVPLRPAGPAPVPGVAPQGGDPVTEENWNVFFADIDAGTWANNWKDNRLTKRSDKSPDFQHQSWKRPGARYNVSVYLDDKKNPPWVAEKLRQYGVVA